MEVHQKESRILLLLKLDSKRLMNKIISREDQYISILSIKRNRDHFSKVFTHSYKNTPIRELVNCNNEVIKSLSLFYSKVDDMEWYLTYTEDLPGLIRMKVDHYIIELQTEHKNLLQNINSQLGIGEEIVLDQFEPKDLMDEAVEEELDNSKVIETDEDYDFLTDNNEENIVFSDDDAKEDQ